ncbi:MAG: hypothetical protein P3W91_001900 [Fervidobacterium sp.]|jgi:hypothetical protein|nr:hypothetical protein [Fervidobacterium sp.]
MLNMRVLDYRITSDSNQVTVNKVRRTEDGEISTRIENDGAEKENLALVGYYSTLSKALRGIQRDYVLSDGIEIQTVGEYRKALESFTRTLENDLEIKEEF